MESQSQQAAATNDGSSAQVVDEKARQRLSQLLELIKRSFQDESFPSAGDREIRQIRKDLEKLNLPLARAPRIYAVLWLIDQTAIADAFDVNNGFTDAAFPFSLGTLPDALDASVKEQFLQAQKAVVTAGASLENGEHVKAEYEALGFEVETFLGLEEWIVESAQTKKRYTLLRRDRPRRGFDAKDAEFLKGLRHEHLATFIGSFEDDRARMGPLIGILLSPPAEMFLSDHLNSIVKRQYGDLAAQKERLAESFGCLANGLEFLQHHELRPLISTRTIIIHDGKLQYITGFNDEPYGRRESSDLSSTTSRTTTRYMYGDENIYTSASSSYIRRSPRSAVQWLGLVFLDILTALNGRSLATLSPRHTQSWLEYRDGWPIWQAVVDKLEEHWSFDGMAPVGWIKEMMSESDDPEHAITQVADKIRAHARNGEGPRFCGSCCMNSAVQASESSSTDPSTMTSSTAERISFRKYWTSLRDKAKSKPSHLTVPEIHVQRDDD